MDVIVDFTTLIRGRNYPFLSTTKGSAYSNAESYSTISDMFAIRTQGHKARKDSTRIVGRRAAQLRVSLMRSA